ncbi:unnamed protein product [Absidia cylindrospora]
MLFFSIYDHYAHNPFAHFHFHSPQDIFAQFFGTSHPFGSFGGPRHGGGGGMFQSMFDDPFFSHGPSQSMFGGPMMMGGGMGGMGGMGSQMQQQQFGGGGMFGGATTSFSSSASSFGGGGVSQSTSTSIRNVNGVQQRVTVTTVQDQNGTHITEDYGNGRKRVVINGVEHENTLGNGADRIGGSQQFQQQQQQQIGTSQQQQYQSSFNSPYY